MKKHIGALLLCAGFCTLVPVVAGQSADGIRAIVVDPSGASVARASISVSTAQGTIVSSLVSDESGTFSIPHLSSGTYALEVSAGGFERGHLTITFPMRVSGTLTVHLDLASTASNLTVTSSRGSVEDVDSTIAFVTSKGRAQLVERPLDTIGNALEGSPGVTVQQTTAAAASPILRGLTGYQTLLLMDGIRFNTSIFRGGPNQYISLVDPNAAQRVEVTLGPSGANYGSDSMGGTINMVTVDPRFAAKRQHEIQGEWGFLGATADLSGVTNARINFGTSRVAVTTGASVSKHNDLRAGGGDDSRNVFRRYIGLDGGQLQSVFGDRLQNTGFLQYSADSKMAVRLATDQTLTLRYLRTDLQNDRSYRDTYGGANRIRSILDPQNLNFGFARYEKLKLGWLDSVAGTFSFNQQNDGSIIKGALLTDIETTDSSQVNARGYSGQATTHIGNRQAVVFGGDIFDERVFSTRFNFTPAAQVSLRDRALYPNNSRYVTTGWFAQDSVALWSNRLRGTFGLRYTGVHYTTRASDNLDAAGKSLGVIDSARTFNDVTFNSGVQWQAMKALAFEGGVSRGFRAPNINDLGAVGAKTLGYDVTAEDAIKAGALPGADSSDGAAATGKKIYPLGPETLVSYEAGFRIQTSRFYVKSHYFDSELHNPISGRTLLFPAGQVPAAVGGVPVTPIAQSAAQKAQGVTAVLTSQSPRAVHTSINDGKTRYFGTDNYLRFKINSQWTAEATYSFLGGLDLDPIRPTRRLPPQEGGFTMRFAPSGRRLWVQAGIRAAGSQSRLNPGDIDDDRIGASRRRSDIQTFFRSYYASQFIAPGADGRPGTADDVFVLTNETLRQVQDRVLPLNTLINGVLVASDSVRVPLFTENPAWASVNFVGGYALSERVNLTFGVNNLLDQNYRSMGSGIDAQGINAFAGVRYKF